MNLKDIIISIFNKPDGGIEVKANIPSGLLSSYMAYDFVNKLDTLMAERAVKEIWKKHGATIIKKVDKKTIGNLTVKKLTALIAKELNAK